MLQFRMKKLSAIEYIHARQFSFTFCKDDYWSLCQKNSDNKLIDPLENL